MFSGDTMIAITAINQPLRIDETGVVRVGKTRVTLDSVIHAYNMGETAEGIIDMFPVLSLADVYATLAYYLKHREEIDAYVAERDRRAEEIRQANRIPGLRDKLLARLQSKASQ